MSNSIFKYGLNWPAELDALQIEMTMISKGGVFEIGGKSYGNGLSYHYEQMRSILWPELDDHRWHALCRDEIVKNKITVLMGPGSSGKTHSAAWVYLCEYMVFPNETCVLVSSTDIRGLELRVWGEIKTLHSRALEKFPYLPGYLIDSKHCISTDNVDEDSVRDMRRGIIGIPCIQSGKYVGIGKYSGVKQKRMRLVADEAQFMGESFLSAFSNLDKNEDFRAVVIGNPNDPLDPLGKAAEPVDGWSDHLEPKKTCTWQTRFMSGVCVNLVGTDSPNFDFPEDQPTRYKYLISREKIANTLSFFAKDSVEYYSQCVGVMKVGILARRVITRDICKKFGACDKVDWDGSDVVVKICALDASYGGDRCVGGHVEFAKDVNGKIVISAHPPIIVPIKPGSSLIPEDQIAVWVKDYCEENDIPPENFFHDSTGRGSLGTALARIWSPKCNPVEFGGQPTARPVSKDLYITDAKTGTRRLQLCNEHYDRFVTELWFSVRYAIEAGQIRNMPQEVVDEMCMREWDKTRAGKTMVETKQDMKLRVGRSCDLGDWFAICIEGARRRGFLISKLANEEQKTTKKPDWLDKQSEEYADFIRSRQLEVCAT